MEESGRSSVSITPNSKGDPVVHVKVYARRPIVAPSQIQVEGVHEFSELWKRLSDMAADSGDAQEHAENRASNELPEAAVRLWLETTGRLLKSGAPVPGVTDQLAGRARAAADRADAPIHVHDPAP